jgi:hypothetical protein
VNRPLGDADLYRQGGVVGLKGIEQWLGAHQEHLPWHHASESSKPITICSSPLISAFNNNSTP